MTVTTGPANLPDKRQEERRAAGVAFGAHALHDGYTDLIYLLLPLWQAEFALGYAALGILRGLFTGAMAGLQIPAGFLANRIGAPLTLSLGTLMTGGGFMLAGWSGGVVMLVISLLLAGIGSATQHPLASELVAYAFSGARSRKILGTYNFSGDLGKMAMPLAGSLLLAVFAWRETVALLGAVGLIAAAAIYIWMPRFQAGGTDAASKPERARHVTYSRFSFPLLVSVGVIDSAGRMAFLTFLPFVLTAKGASIQTIGIALTLVFAGGAFGKLACAFIGARIGTVATVWLTETTTALGIAALLPLPLEGAMVLLPLVGVALNGTSSVLYGSVPDLVEPAKRQHAFGIFYTGTIGGGAVAPVVFGVLGDAVGITNALLTIAAMVLLTLPFTAILRPALPARP
jgi:MFS family permease